MNKGVELQDFVTVRGTAERATYIRPREHSERSKQDEAELALFGKKQRLKRRFGMISIVGLTCSLMITWETILVVMSGGLNNGGPQGLVCDFIFTWIGVISQTLVMAELGSMIPVAGGQYTWVAVLAPRRYAPFFSYMTGWITTIAWQACTASSVYVVGTLVQGLVVMNWPNYIPQPWHATLIFYAVIASALLFNTVLARILPQLESAFMLLNLCGFFAILIPLVYFGPKGSASDVFQTFINNGGWTSNGLAFFVGINPTMLCFIGIDGATHLAEEIENASTVIPRALIIGALINGTTGFCVLITALFSISSLSDAMASSTGYPFMEIFVEAVGDARGATAMIALITFILICANNGYIATSSRMLWAFARERAVPGHAYISRIHTRAALPLVSIGVCATVNLLLALINIGSIAAFEAFTSLTVAAFYTVYMFSTALALWRKVTGKHLRYGPFQLGRLGIPIGIYALGYSAMGAFFSFWPQRVKPSLQQMNWAVVVFSAVICVSLLHWVCSARKTYKGPIIEITPEELRIEEHS